MTDPNKALILSPLVSTAVSRAGAPTLGVCFTLGVLGTHDVGAQNAAAQGEASRTETANTTQPSTSNGEASANPSAFGLPLHEVLFIAGVVLIAGVLLLRLRRKMGRGARGPGAHETPREKMQRISGFTEQRAALDQMSVEVETLTRESVATLHARKRELETLIAEAHRAAAALKRERALLEAAHGSARQAGATIETAPIRPGQRGALAHDAGPDPLGTESTAETRRTGSPHASGADADASLDGRAFGGDHLSRRVCALAADGKSAHEISSALNEPIGKVELILALHAV